MQYGDRLAWAGGDFLFSFKQLNEVINDGDALLTIERNGQTLLRRAPRVVINDLSLKTDSDYYQELVDWQHEASVKGKILDLYTIPYNLTNTGVIAEQLKFLDKEKEGKYFPKIVSSEIDEPLQAGDRIVAVNGTRIKQSYELFALLQQSQVNIILERDAAIDKSISYTKADQEFDDEMDYKNLQKIIQSIGTLNPVTHAGKYILMKPLTPKVRSEFVLTPEEQAAYVNEQAEQRKAVDSIDDSEVKTRALAQLEEQDKRLLLGLSGSQDRVVNYNPQPQVLFSNVFNEITRTITALFSGALSPKFISGPVGIIQVVHNTSMSSIKEALYWLGAISLNLGMLNLLPIPVLDGGTIMLSLYELVTKKRIHPKTLEKLTIPFALLLMGAFLWFTYNDITRIFGGYF